MSENSLYHISTELALILDTDEEIDFSQVDALSWKFEEKIGNCGRYSRLLQDKEAMFAAREKVFAAEKMKMRKQRESLISYMFRSMNAVEASEVTNGDVVAKVKKNPPKVVYAEDFTAPADFLIAQEPKTDTAGIKAALKGGQVVEGATLESGFRLEIK